MREIIKKIALKVTYLTFGLVFFCFLAPIISRGILWYKPYANFVAEGISSPNHFVTLIKREGDLNTKKFDQNDHCDSEKHSYQVGLTNGNVEYFTASKEDYFSSRMTNDGSIVVSLYLGADYYEYAIKNGCVMPLRQKVFEDTDGLIAGGVAIAVVLLVFGLLRITFQHRKRMSNSKSNTH